MFKRLFRSREVARVPAAPQGRAVWAVGDVHGRADLLNPLVGAIIEDARRTGLPTTLVMLGDYVDRGPDSRGVIETLCALDADAALELVALRGNHDDRMHAFLRDPTLGPAWCDFGGREALASYGVAAPARRLDPEAWAETSAALGQAMPDAHRRLLADLRLSATSGDYFFAHAGARPGVPLEAQSADDLMWIRDAFLEDPRVFDKVVVHGHTPVDTPHLDHRRINLDTGAYATGVLSAVRLEGVTRSLLQARALAGRISLDTSPA